ncbi:hypothetical protein ACSBR2_036184 [Camellia fascicularis]
MDSILEVNLITGLNKNLKLHEVLNVLKGEGVEVVTCKCWLLNCEKPNLLHYSLQGYIFKNWYRDFKSA